MRGARFHEESGQEDIQAEWWPAPVAGPGEALFAVEAAPLTIDRIAEADRRGKQGERTAKVVLAIAG